MADEVENFYDDFSEFQLNSGIHERHYLMHEKLIEIGMNKHSSLLEIGAGVGMITSLIRKTITSGSVLVNDISPKSIQLNKKLNNQSNLNFVAGDIVEMDLETKYDFITMFDVLEHIPIEQHGHLFSKFKTLLKPNGILFINIPSPECLRYLLENKPTEVQVIDQPLPADVIFKNIYSNGLILDSFKTYDIWHKNEYQMMFIKHAYNWEPILIPTKKNTLLKKVIRNLRK
ncbi:MAG: class I SAM-dependent methyltransferase [Crocinitomicaceae bacterium]|jgi:trans-aconitate 2-methyltransferase|nr:class I SAM-dependent methyltransferase [Crocinitomicaceae bacterium]MBT5402088.1 class I SAM-dependent methyltransferase [Crocinitomicaceae bacterium]MBT6030456.1 class I SAM-dependent methyltransferase [Crocinitomicaceae bacterium]MBT6515135.1 class I SAM-dependent methyltransferase [Crocinitomicaceae bacterium]